MNVHVKNCKGKATNRDMDETVNNMEERQDAPLAPEISNWEPSALISGWQVLSIISISYVGELNLMSSRIVNRIMMMTKYMQESLDH